MNHVKLYEHFNNTTDALTKLASLPRKSTTDYIEFGEDMATSAILPEHPAISYAEMLYLSMYLNDFGDKLPCSVETIHVSKLYSGQHELFSSKVIEYINEPSNKQPTVFRYKGDNIMVDGHHRAAAQILAGATEIICEVIAYAAIRVPMEKYNQKLYGTEQWKKISVNFGVLPSIYYR